MDELSPSRVVTSPSSPSTASPPDDGGALERALDATDRASIVRDYRRYNELFWRGDVFPDELVRGLADEARALEPRIARKHVPGYKKSGSVSYYDIVEAGPRIHALYRSPALRAFFSEIAGVELLACPDDDPHAAALYYYTEGGDGVGFHYDRSYYAGQRFTVLLGLVNRTEHAKLVCQPYRKVNGPPLELRLATDPGMLVFFNGNNIWHSVTPVVDGDERVVLTLEYVTDPSMTPVNRLVSNLKDAMTYFGFKRLLAPRRRRTT